LVCLYFVVETEEGLQMMGQTDRPWCWIRDYDDNRWDSFGASLQVAMFYAPLTVIFLFNLWIYGFLGIKVGELMQTRMKVRIQKRLLLYLLVFQLCSVWGLANRIYQATHPGHKFNYLLLCLDSAFGPLQGFLNALVYGFNQKLRDRYKEWLCPDTGGGGTLSLNRICCCCCCCCCDCAGGAATGGGSGKYAQVGQGDGSSETRGILHGNTQSSGGGGSTRPDV